MMSALLWIGLGTLLLIGGATAGVFLGKNSGTKVLPVLVALGGFGVAAVVYAFTTIDPAVLANLKFSLVNIGSYTCH